MRSRWPIARELLGAVVAQRVVAGAAEQRLAGRGAAGHADVVVVTVAAVAPQVGHVALAGELQGGRVSPQIDERALADVAGAVGGAAEAGAALDGAVGLEPDHAAAGVAALVVRAGLL
jgi:hypothetical protein